MRALMLCAVLILAGLPFMAGAASPPPPPRPEGAAPPPPADAGGGLSRASSALSLGWVLDQVEAHNPEVAAARAEVLKMEGEAWAARALPDPMVSYEWMEMPGAGFDLSAAGKWRLELSQMVPFPGRLWLAGREADLMAHRAGAMLRDQVEAKVEQAKQAYYALAAASAALEALERSARAARDLAGLSAGRGRFGRLDRMGQLMDAMLGMLAGDLESMRPHWEQERRNAQARLKSLMAAEVGQELPDPELSEDWTTKAWSEAEVWAGAEQGNPMLEEVRHHLGHAGAMRSRELAAWMPDLALKAALEQDQAGMQATSFMAGLTVPFLWAWGQAGRVRAAGAEEEHARALLQAKLLELKEMTRMSSGELTAGAAALKAVEEKVLPYAREALRLAVEGYRSGVVGASDAAQAVREHWSAHERYAQLLAAQGRSLAAVERLMGLRTAASKKEMHHE